MSERVGWGEGGGQSLSPASKLVVAGALDAEGERDSLGWSSVKNMLDGGSMLEQVKGQLAGVSQLLSPRGAAELQTVEEGSADEKKVDPEDTDDIWA